MAPKKSKAVEEGEPAKAAAAAEPTRRVTRAAAASARRQTRSSTQGSSSSASPKPAVPKKRAAAKKSAGASKKKVKTEAVELEEVEGVKAEAEEGGEALEEEGDKAKAEEGNEEGEAAEDDGGGGANTKNIVIERCTQCNLFKTRGDQVKASLEALPGITVTINPVRPRRGCFEIREEGGETFISLLNMKRPFQPMKDLNMQEVIENIIQQISNE